MKLTTYITRITSFGSARTSSFETFGSMSVCMSIYSIRETKEGMSSERLLLPMMKYGEIKRSDFKISSGLTSLLRIA